MADDRRPGGDKGGRSKAKAGRSGKGSTKRPAKKPAKRSAEKPAKRPAKRPAKGSAKRSGAGSRGRSTQKGSPRGGGGGRSRGRGRDELAGPESWGRLARRGASGLDRDGEATDRERRGARTGRSPARDDQAPAGEKPGSPHADPEARDRRPPRPPLGAIDDAMAATLRDRAVGAVDRGRDRPSRRRKPLPGRPRPPADPAVTLVRLLGESKGKRMHRRLQAGAKAFDAERYQEARTELAPLVKDAPELAEGRELMGLVRYRLGQWKQAVEELEAFRELTGSTEQHPVLADCHRALGHWADVDELWAELGRASPSAALVTEGRIVTAGARADRGDTTGAIRLLEQGWKPPKRPRPHHLRRAYALADLYERAGRSPRARELFRWVQAHAPDLADVRDRVRALS